MNANQKTSAGAGEPLRPASPAASTRTADRDFSPAEIVRIHEANCALQFVSAEEQNFRVAMMKFIGRRLGLGELRAVCVSGPAAERAGGPVRR